VWVEAEDFTDCNWQRNVDTAKAAWASGGKCLGGFRERGETAMYVVDLVRPLDPATLHLRFAREMSGGCLSLSVDGEPDPRRTCIALDPTGGWGYSSDEWEFARLDIGQLAAGKHLLIFRADGPANVNVDGFYLGPSNLAPRNELTSGRIAPLKPRSTD
jgi:hypothetical protein